MRLSKVIFLSFFFLFIFQSADAQEKKPKVALVLRGAEPRRCAHTHFAIVGFFGYRTGSCYRYEYGKYSWWSLFHGLFGG